jgi:hypothetical protein
LYRRRVKKLAPEVAAVFAQYPPVVRRKMMALRKLIFETAAATPGAGTLTETLKWGEPSYLTRASGSGSTIRIDWKQKFPERYALYFNCQTTLVDTFRTLFPQDLRFEGNRAIVFGVRDRLPVRDVRFCVAAALTYHLDKAR